MKQEFTTRIIRPFTYQNNIIYTAVKNCNTFGRVKGPIKASDPLFNFVYKCHFTYY